MDSVKKCNTWTNVWQNEEWPIIVMQLNNIIIYQYWSSLHIASYLG